MSSLFEDLKEGLEEAIAYEKGYGEGLLRSLCNGGYNYVQAVRSSSKICMWLQIKCRGLQGN